MIRVYTTPTCPKCTVLKDKMRSQNIEYQEVQDIQLMRTMGILSVPVLEVDGSLLDFATANKWLNREDVSL